MCSFKLKIAKSLTFKMDHFLGGRPPRTAATLNGTLATAFGLGLQLWFLGILYWVVSHTLCVFLATRDPKFMDVLVRHIKHKG